MTPRGRPGRSLRGSTLFAPSSCTSSVRARRKTYSTPSQSVFTKRWPGTDGRRRRTSTPSSTSCHESVDPKRRRARNRRVLVAARGNLAPGRTTFVRRPSDASSIAGVSRSTFPGTISFKAECPMLPSRQLRSWKSDAPSVRITLPQLSFPHRAPSRRPGTIFCPNYPSCIHESGVCGT